MNRPDSAVQALEQSLQDNIDTLGPHATDAGPEAALARPAGCVKGATGPLPPSTSTPAGAR
jgi:hypothetical protein